MSLVHVLAAASPTASACDMFSRDVVEIGMGWKSTLFPASAGRLAARLARKARVIMKRIFELSR